MINLPNPFDSALAPAMGAERPLPSGLADHPIAAADYLPSVTPARAPTTAAAGANAAADFLDDADLYGTGPMFADLPIVRADNERKRAEIIEYEQTHRFRLDERAFWEAIEPAPLFLQRRA